MAKDGEDDVEKTYQRYRDNVIPSLHMEKGPWMKENLYQYRGFWFRPSYGLEAVLWMQEHFKPRQSDVLLATPPKCGTTWLKALIFSVMNRTRFSMDQHPLLSATPHECMPFLDLHLLRTTPISDPELLPSPRLLSCHTPYSALPESVKTIDEGCRIVYVCRDPKDVLISLLHFLDNLRGSGFAPEDAPPLTLQLTLEMFCRGVFAFGPFWDHVLEYWKASLKKPNRILFLKYEDLKKDASTQLKRLAEFLGRPFTAEEEERGLVQEILKLCSFESMSKMEVNRKGSTEWGVKHDAFFRQGRVGDWKSHLTQEMIDRLDEITREKFGSSGLTL